jgi:hypothetical protein
MPDCLPLEDNGWTHLLTRLFDGDDAGNKLQWRPFGALAHFDCHEAGSTVTKDSDQ